MSSANIVTTSKKHSKPKSIQTASAKGQVTIPVHIRKTLGIIAGTPIRFVERNGLVVLEKVDVSLNSLCGMVSTRQSARQNALMLRL